MSERISILDETKKGGYEASIIITFNAYLPFYEEVVLRKLIHQGVKHNIVMMDAGQCAHSIANHAPRLAGRYYSLMPMKSAGAFHPKVILLAGKKKGTLFIGSHNLTLSGFGYNRELSNLVYLKDREDVETRSLMKSTWHQILNWIEPEKSNMPRHLTDMVLMVENFAPWLKLKTDTTSENSRVISSQPGKASLWDQFRDQIKGQAKEIMMAGAFFDSKFEFIRKVQKELRPNGFYVGVDPATVELTSKSRPEDVHFTNCSALGPVGKDGERKGYLHAKAVVVRTQEDETFLAVGSANPSAPAWLTAGLSGNTEMILVRKGDQAEMAAQEIGLTDIPNMPLLTDQDWESAEHNWYRKIEADKHQPSKTGIALVLEEGISFEFSGKDTPDFLICEVLNEEKQLLDTIKASLDKGSYYLDIQEKIKEKVCFIRFEVDGKIIIYLVHNQKLIEENSRTGTQRRFREALASLGTDSPDLATLIKCVDKIIFAKTREKNGTTGSSVIKGTVAGPDDSEGTEKGGPLHIDIGDTNKTKKKYRLRQSDDLAYLLDVLIYHLRIEKEIDSDTDLESKDGKGRSEEEQVGADDEDERSTEGPTADEIAEKTLAFCHTKVHTLIGRMVNLLEALQRQKVSLEDIVIRLPSVLAVLRQLRNCDGKVVWIKSGQTAFPNKEKSRLLEAIVQNLFEDKNSILYPTDEVKDLADSDEMARLKGLILWLAWDSGIQLMKKKPFFESSEERSIRVRNKALMVALAQLVNRDEVVMEEARQSIGILCTSDMDWLDWIHKADKKLQKLMKKPGALSDGNKAEPGDIAIHKYLDHLEVRLILNLEATKANLAYFGKKKDHISYRTDFIKVWSFERLMAP